jgi:hypothetical protein
MVCIGKIRLHHGKTVGLPVAMATLLILNGKITTLVQLPIRKKLHLILKLEEYGVVLKFMPYFGYKPDGTI